MGRREMSSDFPPTLFVTGTDTAVGKTVVSAILVAGLAGEYWKPIQSGAEAGTDTAWLKEKTGLPDAAFHPETYLLSPFLSPHAAAARQGVRIDLAAIRTPARRQASHLIIEGAGGILVPLNETETMADLIVQLHVPVLLVARSTLGTINHTLLSLEKLRHIGADVLGVVMNGPKDEENRKAIETFGDVCVCAEIEPIPEISFKSLSETFYNCFHLKA
jgi:dethiobiotin synthetase